MSWISDADLARMRADMTHMLPDSAVIQTKSLTSDGAGGWTESWTAAGTVACRLDPIGRSTSSQIMETLGRESLTGIYQLTVPYDAPIAPDGQAVINSTTYQFVRLDDAHSWRVSRRAIVEIVR